MIPESSDKASVLQDEYKEVELWVMHSDLYNDRWCQYAIPDSWGFCTPSPRPSCISGCLCCKSVICILDPIDYGVIWLWFLSHIISGDRSSDQAGRGLARTPIQCPNQIIVSPSCWKLHPYWSQYCPDASSWHSGPSTACPWSTFPITSFYPYPLPNRTMP